MKKIVYLILFFLIFSISYNIYAKDRLDCGYTFNINGENPIYEIWARNSSIYVQSGPVNPMKTPSRTFYLLVQYNSESDTNGKVRIYMNIDEFSDDYFQNITSFTDAINKNTCGSGSLTGDDCLAHYLTRPYRVNSLFYYDFRNYETDGSLNIYNMYPVSRFIDTNGNLYCPPVYIHDAWKYTDAGRWSKSHENRKAYSTENYYYVSLDSNPPANLKDKEYNSSYGYGIVSADKYTLNSTINNINQESSKMSTENIPNHCKYNIQGFFASIGLVQYDLNADVEFDVTKEKKVENLSVTGGGPFEYKLENDTSSSTVCPNSIYFEQDGTTIWVKFGKGNSYRTTELDEEYEKFKDKDIPFNSEEYKSCVQMFGSDFLQFIDDNVFKLVYIGIPILLILLTTFDFAKVVFVEDKDGMKNATDKLKKRIILAILIYLVPKIVIFLVNYIEQDDIVSQCALYYDEQHSSVTSK